MTQPGHGWCNYLTVFYVAVRPDHGKREILRYRYCHSGVRAWGLPFSGYHCLGQNDIPVSETGRVRLGLHRLIDFISRTVQSRWKEK